MKVKTVLLPLFLMIICSSCFLNHWDTRLSIDNRSGNLVYYVYRLTAKQDTILGLEHCATSSMYYIPPKSAIVISSLQNWDALKSDTTLRLHVYIFNVDTVNTIGVCDAWANSKYLVRYDLNYDLLENMNWTIIYPLDSILGKPSLGYLDQNPNTTDAMIQKWESMTTKELQHPL